MATHTNGAQIGGAVIGSTLFWRESSLRQVSSESSPNYPPFSFILSFCQSGMRTEKEGGRQGGCARVCVCTFE